MPSTAMLTALVQCLARAAGVSRAVELAAGIPGLEVNAQGQVLQYDHTQVKAITRLLIESYDVVTAEVGDEQALEYRAVGAAPSKEAPEPERSVLPTRVLIVDGHALVREALTSLINAQPDFAVIGQSGTLREAARSADEQRPELILLDLALPDTPGGEAVRILRALFPDSKLIILAAHDDDERLFAAIAAGAASYLLKSSAPTDLLTRLRAVARGEASLSPAMAGHLLDRLVRQKAARSVSRDLAEALSARETEVLQLVAQGHTNRQIATALGLSIRTVETYRASLMSKVGVNNRADLVHFAVEHNLVRRS